MEGAERFGKLPEVKQTLRRFKFAPAFQIGVTGARAGAFVCNIEIELKKVEEGEGDAAIRPVEEEIAGRTLSHVAKMHAAMNEGSGDLIVSDGSTATFEVRSHVDQRRILFGTEGR